MKSEYSYYEILDIPPRSSFEEIKKAFRRMAKLYHPDINSSSNAHQIFLKVHEAYKVLKDEDSRKSYDSTLFEYTSSRWDEECLFLMEVILAYSSTNHSFDPDFVISCYNQFYQGKRLSVRQHESLENIISSFHIEIEMWEDDITRQQTIDEHYK